MLPSFSERDSEACFTSCARFLFRNPFQARSKPGAFLDGLLPSSLHNAFLNLLDRCSTFGRDLLRHEDGGSDKHRCHQDHGEPGRYRLPPQAFPDPGMQGMRDHREGERPGERRNEWRRHGVTEIEDNGGDRCQHEIEGVFSGQPFAVARPLRCRMSILSICGFTQARGPDVQVLRTISPSGEMLNEKRSLQSRLM